MEQTAIVENTPTTDTKSPPWKKSRNQTDENLQTTSNHTVIVDDNLTGPDITAQQSPD